MIDNDEHKCCCSCCDKLVRITRSMLKKLTDAKASLYSSSMYNVDGSVHAYKVAGDGTAISNEDYLSMMKRMNEVEEKVNVLSNNALHRVESLEQSLEAVLARQGEFSDYIEKKKRKKRFFAF